MLQSLKGLILHKIKYKENELICRAYTQEYGLVSFIVRNLHLKKSQNRPANFLLLSLIEMILYDKKNSTIKMLKESKSIYHYKSLYTQEEKIAIVFFLSEFLNTYLKEELPNEKLFEFIVDSLKILDSKKADFADFHLIFILNLSKYLGFYPNKENQNLNHFSLKEGVFTAQYSSSHCSLNRQDTLLLKKLTSLNFSKEGVYFNKDEREKLLSILLKYFTFHIEGSKKLKSIEVLKHLV